MFIRFCKGLPVFLLVLLATVAILVATKPAPCSLNRCGGTCEWSSDCQVGCYCDGNYYLTGIRGKCQGAPAAPQKMKEGNVK
jgi:hypothetical protein